MPYYYYWDWTYLLIIPGLILGLIAQAKVKSAYAQCSRIPAKCGLTASQMVADLLRRNGNTRVRVGHVSGELTDHYDPSKEVLNLSDGVYSSNSIAAMGIAAHEAGHAMQKLENYAPLNLRSAIVPAVNISSSLSTPMFILGLIFAWQPLVYIGIGLFAASTVFALVTLPVEFDASKRAIQMLSEGGYISGAEEERNVRKVLSAAALTYVAAAVTSLLSLLRFLLAHDYVETTEAGGLIVGLAGERVTNNYKFYAVFQENVEYTVRCESQEIGTLVAPPPPGEKVAIAGHVWIVEEVDHKRHLLYVTQVKGRVPAYFGECPGDINTRVLERMRRALDESAPYPYLQPNARARLAQARRVARNGGLTKEPLVNLGGNMWCLLPWLGSYAFLALERLLKIKCAKELGLKGLDSSRPYYMTFIMAPEVDERAFYTVVANEAEALADPMELIYPGEVPTFEKYDELVPELLVRKGFAEGTLDVAGMKARVAQWV